MAGDERRAEVEAATDALLEDSGLRRYGAHRATVERRVRIAFEAADRLRDARGDDEAARCPDCHGSGRQGGNTMPASRVCPTCDGWGRSRTEADRLADAVEGALAGQEFASQWVADIRALGAEIARLRDAARSLQGEDHEARSFTICTRCWVVVGIDGENNLDRATTVCSHLGPFIQCKRISAQDEDHEAGIDAAVLAWHAACKDDERLNLRGALNAAIAAYLARVSPSRDGTVAVEDVERQAYENGRYDRTLAIVGMLRQNARLSVTDEARYFNAGLADKIEREFARSVTGEQTDHGGDQ